jgi:AGCS family alanine or glycine:cation symporter
MGAVDIYRAFETVSWWFKYIVVCIIPVMGLNVMIAWGFFGERITSYYLGKIAGKIFLALYILAGFIGGMINNVDVMVAFLDSITMTIVFPNLIGVLLLSGIVWKEFKNFNVK